MNPQARQAGVIEAAFLAGVEANLKRARGSLLPGETWTWTEQDQTEQVLEVMSQARLYDREMLRQMPANASKKLVGWRRRFLFGRKKASVTVATVLTPLNQCVDETAELPPIDAATLLSHVESLLEPGPAPKIVGVCSPSGFTEGARSGRVQLPNVTLILVEPTSNGGWRVTPTGSNVKPQVVALFDPETTEQRLDRIARAVDQAGATLITGGLSASTIARQVDLPIQEVMEGFEALARHRVDLSVARESGDALLYRGAATEMEDEPMSLMDRLRSLFDRKGEEARKIDELSKQRAKLDQRRQQLHDDIRSLEKREDALLAEGKQAASDSARLRTVQQIKQIRGEMGRLNATARMVSRQMDVISTHIHNLTLVQQGKSTELPTSEDLAADAVRAEEMLEQLEAEVGLAETLDTGTGETAISDEERAILEELKAPGESAPPDSAPADSTAEQSAMDEPDRREPEPE